MKKSITIILMTCLLFGSPNQLFSDEGSQLTNIVQTYSNGGEGDVGPPHMDKINELFSQE